MIRLWVPVSGVMIRLWVPVSGVMVRLWVPVKPKRVKLVFVAKQTALMSKSKDRLVRNQNKSVQVVQHIYPQTVVPVQGRHHQHRFVKM